ncbi:MAG: HEAT repeat domain-containing protein [Syntrophales bacterium]
MEKAIARLICDLGDNDCHIRFAAARTLGDIGADDNPIVGNVLIEALKDSIWFVRLAALQTIKEIRLDAGILAEKITPLLQDEHEDVREYAAYTLGNLGPKAAPVVTSLTNALAADLVWYVRATIAWALGEIGPAAGSACSQLVTCLTDDEIEVRIMAAKSLGMISQGDNREVLAALEEAVNDKNQHPEVREKVRETLTQIKK